MVKTVLHDSFNLDGMPIKVEVRACEICGIGWSKWSEAMRCEGSHKGGIGFPDPYDQNPQLRP